MVDPDRWLEAIHGQVFTRTIQPNGSVAIDHRPYYIGRAFAGRKVTLVVNASQRCQARWLALVLDACARA
jgi:hypothetical protein